MMYLEAIESHHLPGDILNDIPAKYVDRAVICEVSLFYFWNALLFMKCSSRKGGSVSAESSPTVSKLCLKMSLENIVKDIPRLLTSLRHMVI
ncbi:hypothetical protein JHK86_040838 [Glycine max]|nr:hypothetical protein JHK86_040838 [Glycine max]